MRELGYTFDDEDAEIGFCCIGALAFDYTDKAVATITIARTSALIPSEQVKHLGFTLMSVAAEISSQLGNLNCLGPNSQEHCCAYCNATKSYRPERSCFRQGLSHAASEYQYTRTASAICGKLLAGYS